MKADEPVSVRTQPASSEESSVAEASVRSRSITSWSLSENSDRGVRSIPTPPSVEEAETLAVKAGKDVEGAKKRPLEGDEEEEEEEQEFSYYGLGPLG